MDAENRCNRTSQRQANSTSPKSRTIATVEYILLAVYLCALAIRTTYTEAPTAHSPVMAASIFDNIYSLSVSGILILSFLVWLVCAMSSGRFAYRRTGIEIGMGIFCIAAIVSIWAASDKRLAITTVATMTAPVAAGLLLVQLLDSTDKIRLVIAVVAALGVVSTYRSAEQLLISNQMTIEQYEKTPQTVLEPLGIRPGTLQHFLFEHRLYARTISGFFTTSNSLGSFLLMALFAGAALWIPSLSGNAPRNISVGKIALPAAATLLMAAVLLLTRSKGAILSALLTTCVFIAAVFFIKWLHKMQKILVGVLLLVGIGGVGFGIFYGVKHDRLPGGNSMLVRWQYWYASAKMVADHPLAGVGAGNFPHFYPHYKPDPAPESVADPHNFVLSILTQYGPLGLVGFLAMVFVPLHRILAPQTPVPSALTGKPRTTATGFMLIVSAAMLFVRPLLMRTPIGDSLELLVYGAVTLYIAPAAAFIIGFWVFAKHTGPLQGTRHTKAALLCGLVGALIHGLIDFTIFEPGVFMTFWTLLACLVAQDLLGKTQPTRAHIGATYKKVLLTTGALLMIGLYIICAWLPVWRCDTRMNLAQQAASAGRFDAAHRLLDAAAETDRLSGIPCNLNGRLYVQQYDQSGERKLLENAQRSFATAIERNPADYKNHEKMNDVCMMLGQAREGYDWGLRATQLYPGCDRLWFNLAKASEQLNRKDEAKQYYAKAVEIEDSYRWQFRIMYPQVSKIVSRLGDENYRFAQQRLRELSN